MLRTITLSPTRTLSAIEFLGLAAAGELQNLLGGLDAVPQALAAQLDVRTASPAVSVRRNAAGVDVSWRDAQGTPQNRHVDACVIATPFAEAMKLLPDLAEQAPDLVSRTGGTPSILVHLAYRLRPDAVPYVVAVSQDDSPWINGVFLEHNKAPDRAPEGKSLFTLYLNSDAAEHMRDWRDEKICGHAGAFIESMFSKLKGQQELAIARRFDYVCHQGKSGYYTAVAQLLNARSSDDPIQLAGDYLTLANQETATAWGERAAANLGSEWTNPD